MGDRLIQQMFNALGEDGMLQLAAQLSLGGPSTTVSVPTTTEEKAAARAALEKLNGGVAWNEDEISAMKPFSKQVMEADMFFTRFTTGNVDWGTAGVSQIERLTLFHKVDNAWVGMAWEKGVMPILCVPLENNAAKESGNYRAVGAELVQAIRGAGVDMGTNTNFKVLYRRIAHWPNESGVCAFAFAIQACSGGDLDELKTRDEVIRVVKLGLEALIRDADEP